MLYDFLQTGVCSCSSFDRVERHGLGNCVRGNEVDVNFSRSFLARAGAWERVTRHVVRGIVFASAVDDVEVVGLEA